MYVYRIFYDGDMRIIKGFLVFYVLLISLYNSPPIHTPDAITTIRARSVADMAVNWSADCNTGR